VAGPPANRWLGGQAPRGDDYDRRWATLAAAGHDIHGEAGLVTRLGPRSVLDAGCGTGRVAIELAQRGLDVVGVDLDPAMLSAARAKAPHLPWVQADLATFAFRRQFDGVVLAGNVMIFLAPGTEASVVANLAAHLGPGGLLVAGFTLGPGRLDLASYDDLAARAGCQRTDRWATWEGAAFVPGGDYAVSVHRRD
jgi:SAM-dependent methyltransferase